MVSSDEMSGTGDREKTPAPMGKSDAKSGGDVSSGGFAARAQGPGGPNANAGSQ
ncbi:hypothetical protein AG0111_0g7978 [Alternaria gaisen]|uniref:Uncharacterized protein n=1 Tax=Alternaria gaisen TaxID=167740 RepID=A0ACB6FFH1_9PLEO|nr:hypothetical protein AG0111_0g7978 [Alternaria gaisen]